MTEAANHEVSFFPTENNHLQSVGVLIEAKWGSRQGHVGPQSTEGLGPGGSRLSQRASDSPAPPGGRAITRESFSLCGAGARGREGRSATGPPSVCSHALFTVYGGTGRPQHCLNAPQVHGRLGTTWVFHTSVSEIEIRFLLVTLE